MIIENRKSVGYCTCGAEAVAILGIQYSRNEIAREWDYITCTNEKCDNYGEFYDGNPDWVRPESPDCSVTGCVAGSVYDAGGLYLHPCPGCHPDYYKIAREAVKNG